MTTQADSPASFMKWLAVIVGAVVLLTIGGLFACSAMYGDSDGVSDTEVRNQCREWARDRLQSPSTAEFKAEEVAPAGDNRWTVTGAIDAENGFGATVRATYTCTIRLDGDTWRGSARVNG